MEYREQAESKLADASAECLLSPNGKWLLWNEINHARGWLAHAVNIETLHTVTARLKNGTHEGFWLTDSSGWIDMCGSWSDGNELTIHQLEGNLTQRSVPIVVTYASQFLGITHNREVVATDTSLDRQSTPGIGQDSFDLYLTDLRASTPVAVKSTIPFPPRVKGHKPVLSPDGSQIAWTCSRDSSPQSFFQRVLVRCGIKQHSSLEIWVGPVRGGQMRQIGYLNDDDSKEWFDKLKWTPDGKHLSYLWNEDLWTVTVE